MVPDDAALHAEEDRRIVHRAKTAAKERILHKVQQALDEKRVPAVIRGDERTVDHARGEQPRHERDEQRDRRDQADEPDAAIDRAALGIAVIHIGKAQQQHCRTEDQAAARAGHEHHEVQKRDREEVPPVTRGKVRRGGQRDEQHRRAEIAVLEIDRGKVLHELLHMARIKQRHHKAREQTAGIKDLQHPLGDVIVARAVRLAAAQQVDQQHHNAEAERIVQRRGREILLAGDEAQAAKQRCDRHGHHAVQAAAVARCAGIGPDVHEQRRRCQQADPPEAQQAVELIVKLRAHHGQQHDREQDAQQIVAKQQQEDQRRHDQNAAHDRQSGRHEHREHQKADREIQLAVPEPVSHALTGGDQRRRAADALIEKRAHAVKHPREPMAAPRLLRIRLDRFIKSIHKHQKSSGKLRRDTPAREEKRICVTG